tara:strand:- start:1279 stop:1764 length:486 start_codon:yes stop_codon:yes gene_type:complete
MDQNHTNSLVMTEMDPELPIETTVEVKDTCLCFRTQRAARALARRFDQAFAPLGLTHGQFSLLMTLNQPQPPKLTHLAAFLGMDRTSVTAKLKAVVRNEWVTVEADANDRRNRNFSLTDAGREILKQAVPIWRRTHAEIERGFTASDLSELKTSLDQLAAE